MLRTLALLAAATMCAADGLTKLHNTEGGMPDVEVITDANFDEWKTNNPKVPAPHSPALSLVSAGMLLPRCHGVPLPLPLSPACHLGGLRMTDN
jgi:hypothetical protein